MHGRVAKSWTTLLQVVVSGHQNKAFPERLPKSDVGYSAKAKQQDRQLWCRSHEGLSEEVIFNPKQSPAKYKESQIDKTHLYPYLGYGVIIISRPLVKYFREYIEVIAIRKNEDLILKRGRGRLRS